MGAFWYEYVFVNIYAIIEFKAYFLKVLNGDTLKQLA